MNARGRGRVDFYTSSGMMGTVPVSLNHPQKELTGFPTGISGMALMARAYNQAQKFGVEMAIPDEVVSLQDHPASNEARFLLGLGNDERVSARAVVVASGARYRRLEAENLAAFAGACVHYWASPLDAKLGLGQEVALVGAGNSAGQAALYLANQVAKVWLLVRGPSLDTSMSRYLVERIAARPNIAVLTQTEVSALEGQGGVLEAVRWRHVPSGRETRHSPPLPILADWRLDKPWDLQPQRQRDDSHAMFSTGVVDYDAWLDVARARLYWGEGWPCALEPVPSSASSRLSAASCG